jgi:hypothetical protein
MALKKCSSCKEQKSSDAYSKSKLAKDGLANQCKVCAKECAKEWREKNRYDGILITEKNCSTCEKIKNTDCFYKDKSRKDGFANKCKDCIKQYRIENRETLCVYAMKQNLMLSNKEKVFVDGKTCSNCKEYRTRDKFWKSKHYIDGLYGCCIDCKKRIESSEHRKLTRCKNARDWYLNNKDYALEYAREWDKNKRNTNHAYRLRRNVMHAINNKLKNKAFNSTSLTKAIFKHLNYTEEQLKLHLESLFEPWMNWGNWGKYNPNKKTWQIDHIIPQSKLPFSDFNDENFQKCWALSNLRPLETIANIKKGDRLIAA